jgi:hypothetical protein
MTTELHAAEPDTVTLSAETVRVLILQESVLQQGAGQEAPARTFDPYNTDVATPALDREPRKSLDDMRRLSEAIKLSRVRPKGVA